MREAVGSYWLTIIVITFIVLFTGYLCLSINLNKSYKVKNEIINIIQKNNGLSNDAMQQISDYLARVGYRTNGRCYDYETPINSKGQVSSNRNGFYCVNEMITSYETDSEYVKEQFPKSAYYQIRVFFSVDLPIVRNVFTFGIKGSTKKLFYPETMKE